MQSKRNAEAAGVNDRLRFEQTDLFTADLHTAVMETEASFAVPFLLAGASPASAKEFFLGAAV